MTTASKKQQAKLTTFFVEQISLCDLPNGSDADTYYRGKFNGYLDAWLFAGVISPLTHERLLPLINQWSSGQKINIIKDIN
jgi:hypothetical protein